MKKYILLLFISFIMLPVCAQQMKIGYFSYNAVLKATPDYLTATANIENLKKQYDAEIQIAQKDFNEKYENFIENQDGMASAIREKRQSELQSILERNMAFKQESERLLAKAEEEALAPLRAKLDNAIKSLGSEKDFIVILNTDNNAAPYINPVLGEDVTEILINRIR
jgi:outer membrane protein